jgi:predicted dehydrogenase
MTETGSAAPIGVALLGFGFAGQTFHAPFITTTPGLALRVVASRQTARVAAHHPDVDVVATPLEAIMRDDIALVVVATPNDSHAPLAEAAMRAGRHVVVDKPFTVTLDEARALVATAEETGRLLSVYQNRRFDSDVAGVREAIQADTIGEVVEVRSEISRWRPVVRDRWRERPGPGAGLWYDLGPHLVDQAVAMFGMPDSVTAAIRALRPGASIDDWFHVRLAYATRDVVLSSSMLSADAAPRFVVRGTAGALVKHGSDHQERRLMAGDRPGGAGWGHDPDPLLVLREGAEPLARAVPPGDYGRFYAGMRDAMRDGGPVPVTPAEAMAVMAIIIAGIQSSAEGRAVSPSAVLTR